MAVRNAVHRGRPSLNSLRYSRTLLRFFRIFHTVENECHLAQCLFTHRERVIERVIRTWRAKRIGAPSLTAAKRRLSVAASWLG